MIFFFNSTSGLDLHKKKKTNHFPLQFLQRITLLYIFTVLFFKEKARHALWLQIKAEIFLRVA